jgi:hypothetical protein
MIVKVKSSERLRDLARAFRYRRHDIIIMDYDSVELIGGYWDGGSRSAYALYTPPSTITALRFPTDPPQFGGATPKTFEIPSGSFVVEGGIFRGKPAHLTIFGANASRYFCEAGEGKA